MPDGRRRTPGVVRLALAGLVAAAAAAGPGCGPRPAGNAELRGATMGTSYSIKLSPAPPAAARAALQAQIEQRLERINRQMSTYRDDSALSRFNGSTTIDWQPMPRAVVELVVLARGISDATGGLYDVTVGPLVELWGFGRAPDRDTPPAATEIEALLPRVGYRLLAHRDEPPALRKTVPGLQLDLSSIAKGRAVDELAGLVEAAGHGAYLVEIGGDLRGRGRKASGEPWRVAIEQPLADRRAVQRVVVLDGIAMATSGDYRNFFESGGRRYSHTIDPRTGQSVRHRLASVTVFAAQCALADAWATALMALGDEQGPRVADANGIEALFIVRDENGLREVASARLAAAGRLQAASAPSVGTAKGPTGSK
jgi:thiamine biosynthesis lipoprotein